MNQSSVALIPLLRSTLEKLKRTEDLSQDDPALRELKRLIVVMIAELETARAHKPAA
jgi:hypothetical protein